MLAEKIQLEKDEKILIQVRKHWFILTIQILTLVLLALFPVLVYVIVGNFSFGPQAIGVISPHTDILTFAYLAWLLFTWMAIWNVWTNYYLDLWIITNKRLIAIDQQGLFTRETGSFRLERLQDINVTISGFIATMLDFGTLEAETASGSEKEFRADGLPHPRELKSTILAATDSLMNEYRGKPQGNDTV